MLTQEQKKQFKKKGYIRIKEAFSKNSASKMEKKVWDELYRLNKIKRDDSKTWNIIQATKLQGIKQDSVFDPIGGIKTIQAIDELLGKGKWQEPSNWGQFLVTFPTKDIEWTVPHAIWHSDFEYEKDSRSLHGLLLSSFINNVKPRAGGTAFIEGSHKLVERFVDKQSPNILNNMKTARKKLLKSEPWLMELSNNEIKPNRIEKFMETTTLVSGIPLKVREMTGKAGDIIIAHPWLLHTPALNCGDGPRMMRVQRIRTKKLKN